MNLTFHTDGGHGWLQVPLDELTASGFQPSSYSYRDSAFAYLEEDCDMGGFLDTLKSRGISPVIVDVYDGTNSPIRGYARFPRRPQTAGPFQMAGGAA